MEFSRFSGSTHNVQNSCDISEHACAVSASDDRGLGLYDPNGKQLYTVQLKTAAAKKGGGEEVFRDALAGQVLIPELVREARRKELEYFIQKGVWEKRPRAESMAKVGGGST